MRSFLAVSVAPGSPRAVRRPDDVTLSCLAHATVSTTHATEDGWVAFAGTDRDDQASHPEQSFTARLTRSVRSRAADVSADTLARMLRDPVDGAGLAELLPPFAAAHWAGPGHPIVAAVDWLGFRQLYWWQGDGIAALSTSALALAALSGAPLDIAAIGVQSLAGWQVGLGTAFQGITKLAPGCLVTLRHGRVAVRPYVEDIGTFDDETPPLADVVDEMADSLRGILTAYVEDHPGTVIQLTGGQDSRILLSAVPPRLRSALRAMTLGTEGAADVRIAALLSEKCGIEHQVHWLDRQPPLDPSAAHALAVGAARDLDCAASPMALAPLLLAESNLHQGHRLSGLGGEVARGFYYLGQPRQATVSPRLVHRLAEWRLFTNESVPADALDPDFAAARQHAGEQISAVFAGYSRDWLRATDEFYLWQRMQRWAGAHGSPAAVTRFFVNPLFDRRIMQLALATAPDDKRDSRLSGRLMQRLDPRLARIPLDSGLVPARLGRAGPAAAVARARVTGRKAVGKVRQRLGGVRRPQLGAPEMADLVVAHWRADPDAVAPLRRSGIVRPEWLDGLLDGRHEAAATTVAFLMNIAVAAGVAQRGQQVIEGTRSA
ncbi:hypothetical protein ABZ807_17145 [Micromonospora sp. NPDC047548]|uniref:hypothetical protein n=1 Tax=Micromonospora sp. NPDC047548 TaxID=3155624 RepID=UPI0033D0FA3D